MEAQVDGNMQGEEDGASAGDDLMILQIAQKSRINNR